MSIKSNCIDFHIHTTCSDGTDSPEELVEKLAKNDKCVYVTDYYKNLPTFYI